MFEHDINAWTLRRCKNTKGQCPLQIVSDAICTDTGEVTQIASRHDLQIGTFAADTTEVLGVAGRNVLTYVNVHHYTI